jgi:ribosome-associated protein
MQTAKINTPYIKLGQFLKFVNIISNGSEEKIFLLTNEIYVNEIKENRRGRKLYPGDKILVQGETYEIVCE